MNVSVRGRTIPCRTVTFDAARNAVCLIEQRLLPHHFQIVATPDYRATARAISDMIVRGAGAIGATAAYGLAQARAPFAAKIPGNFPPMPAAFLRHSKPPAPPRWTRSTP